jgi:hypothetical protein
MLVVRGVPYVDHAQAVRQGMLVVPLDLAGDRTVAPTNHGALWSGGHPCDHLGKPLSNVVQGPFSRVLGGGITVSHQLCNKPHRREFYDYHELVTTYVALITPYATMIDRKATALGKCGVIAVDDQDSPFHYADTATARARLGSLNGCFPGSVGIVGLGGTGSYVLDLVAKAPVRMIHLFDNDIFLQHNSFRAPGAASLKDIEAGRAKVDHFAAIYSQMHRGIAPHRTRLGPGNLDLLRYIDFVFLCMDDGAAKLAIIEALENTGKSFIDVGIGVHLGKSGLFGSVRVTTSTPEMRNHIRDKKRIPFVTGGQADPYASNIQLASLNALNAALAVNRWLRLIGFYADGSGEHHSIYDIDFNHINNADVQL